MRQVRAQRGILVVTCLILCLVLSACESVEPITTIDVTPLVEFALTIAKALVVLAVIIIGLVVYPDPTLFALALGLGLFAAIRAIRDAERPDRNSVSRVCLYSGAFVLLYELAAFLVAVFRLPSIHR